MLHHPSPKILLSFSVQSYKKFRYLTNATTLSAVKLLTKINMLRSGYKYLMGSEGTSPYVYS